MVQYVITPWKYHHELLQVKDEIYQRGEYAPPVDKRRHAIGWIEAWKIRGNLPHAVESTAFLVDAILHHDINQNSTFSIKATYAVAFSRFVTGYCDIEQNAKYKKTMFDVAKEIDMPASFIELRHDVTHQDLPSVARLMKFAHLALAWLWDHYWASLDNEKQGEMPMEEDAPEPMKGPQAEKRIREILEAFISGRKVEIRSGSKDMSKDSASGVACLELVNACLNDEEPLSSLCQIMLEEKMLIPANREMHSSMEGAAIIWDNFLRRMTVHQGKFIGLLLGAMAKALSQATSVGLENNTTCEAVSHWILHIFNGQGWSIEAVAPQVQQTRHEMVNECLMSPNHWTTALASALIQTGPEGFQEQWKPFLES